MRHLGSFENGVAKMELEIIAGTGSGELTGLSGSGSFESGHAAEYTLTLDCAFAD